MTITVEIKENGVLVKTVTLTDTETRYMEDIMPSVPDWIENAIVGRVDKAVGQFTKMWQQRLMNDPAVTQIPATKEGLVATILARPDYKNKAAREAEVTERIQATQKQPAPNREIP